MIIVDELTVMTVLARRSIPRLGDGPVSTTWGFHYRLLRALVDDGRAGQLSRMSTADLRARAAVPSAQDFVVLDPRPVTPLAAELALRHRLNALASELVAAAVHHEATVVLAQRNVGRTWPEVFEAEGVAMEVH